MSFNAGYLLSIFACHIVWPSAASLTGLTPDCLMLPTFISTVVPLGICKLKSSKLARLVYMVAFLAGGVSSGLSGQICRHPSHVLDPYSAAMYTASYMMKGVWGMTRLLCEVNEQCNTGIVTVSERIRALRKALVQHQQISIQGAVCDLLGLCFSRKCVFVHTSLAADRAWTLKDRADLASLVDGDTKLYKEAILLTTHSASGMQIRA